MLIDCDTCRVRGDACADCVVGLLFGGPPVGAGGATDTGRTAAAGPPPADPDELERRALRVLADAGFEVTVLQRSEPRPRLRLVSSRRGRPAA